MIKLFCLSIALFTLFSCSKPAPVARLNQLRIGIIGTLSGEYAAKSGKPLVNAAKLHADSINRQGGILIAGQKYEIVLKIEDDFDNPQSAVTAAQKLINRDSVAVIVGLTKSRLALPVAVLADSLQIPLITTVSSNPQITAGKKFVFRTTFSDNEQGRVLADFAITHLKLTKAAVLYDIASSFNQGMADIFKADFIKRGGVITAYETFVTGDTDFREQLAVIKKSRPDFVFLPNYNLETSKQVRQSAEIGLKTIFLGPDSWASQPVEDYAVMDGSFYCTDYSMAATNQENIDFLRLYRQTYNIEAVRGAAIAYDSFGMLFQALSRCVQLNSLELQKQLGSISNYHGVAGTVSYHGGGDPVRSITVMQIKNNQQQFYRQIDPVR